MLKNKSACHKCPVAQDGMLEKLGVRMGHWDYVIALAGNPNTGKSTIFNALTGLRQHTGNWPGKTIARAEGGFSYESKKYKLVDLPGTYSLLSFSQDEEVARDFILFGQPDVTVIVVDATRLERNLNLVLQVLQITNRAVVCLNLMDEARAHGLRIDDHGLARDLGVPVIPCAARQNEGIPFLIKEVARMSFGDTIYKPRRLEYNIPILQDAVKRLETMLKKAFPAITNAPWIAMRLLEGDRRIIEAVKTGELGSLGADHNAEILKATKD